jgi:hypothetical protein
MVRIMFEVFVALVGAAVATELASVLRRAWQRWRRRSDIA